MSRYYSKLVIYLKHMELSGTLLGSEEPVETAVSQDLCLIHSQTVLK